MVEFVHKFEPIYIQRQITQALNYVFPDSTIQWRLNWFNEVKMPVLTTLLLYSADYSLEENMEKFKKMITLDSLTQDELFLKNAMKSQQMHTKAIEIISEAMNKIINVENQPDSVREVNTDQFLSRLNQELLNSDPQLAFQLGIKIDKKDKHISQSAQTPEELAAQEAEREKMLQESMQAEMVATVVNKLSEQMNDFDAR